MLRLIRRLAADPDLPRGVRIRLGALLAYLASPIDLIPDFIPGSATPTTPSSSPLSCAGSRAARASASSARTGPAPTTASPRWPGSPAYPARHRPEPVRHCPPRPPVTGAPERWLGVLIGSVLA
ncbi:MAG TPA: DUF1232 domain-containing protein, partial [Streptosporangiaceae bacterium]|nr:DUF1232 domain-containing protein [Streptosporangiaceae bacterium]